MQEKCDKCGLKTNGNGSRIHIERIFNKGLLTAESTYICEICYQSFIVYFDNFMEEK